MTRIPLNRSYEQSQDLKDKLEMSTAEIGLSVRTTNCLEECGIYTVRDLLNTTPDRLLGISNFGDKTLEEVYKAWPDARERNEYFRELDVLRGFPKYDAPRGTGYVLDTIWSVRRALEESTFEDVVRTAILFGNDTDTTACVAGGLAGIRFGPGGIPPRWLEQLRGFDLVEPRISTLLARGQ